MVLATTGRAWLDFAAASRRSVCFRGDLADSQSFNVHDSAVEADKVQ